MVSIEAKRLLAASFLFMAIALFSYDAEAKKELTSTQFLFEDCERSLKSSEKSFCYGFFEGFMTGKFVGGAKVLSKLDNSEQQMLINEKVNQEYCLDKNLNEKSRIQKFVEFLHSVKPSNFDKIMSQQAYVTLEYFFKKEFSCIKQNSSSKENENGQH